MEIQPVGMQPAVKCGENRGWLASHVLTRLVGGAVVESGAAVPAEEPHDVLVKVLGEAH